MKHQIDHVDNIYTCRVCHLQLRVDPETLHSHKRKFYRDLAECPELPIMNPVPVHLAPITWFNTRSIKPSGEPVGCYLHPSGGSPTYVMLYEKKSAVPVERKYSVVGVNNALKARGSKIRFVIDN